MNMRKLSILLLAIFLFTLTSIPVYAGGGAEVITLDKVKELVRANSRDLARSEITKNKLDVMEDMAKESYQSVYVKQTIKSYEKLIDQTIEKMEALDPGDPEYSELQDLIVDYEKAIGGNQKILAQDSSVLANKINYNNAKSAYEDMDRTIENAELSSDYAVTTMYYNLSNTERGIKAAQKNLDVAGLQLRIERLKLELGMSTNVDVKGIMVQYNQVNDSLNSLRDQRLLIIRQMNDMMGRDLNSEFQTNDMDFGVMIVKINADDLIKKANGNSLKFMQLERDIKNYQDYSNDTDDNKNYRLQQRNKELAQLELTALEEGIKQDVKKLAEAITSNYGAWETAKLSREKAELTYQTNKLKYDLGMIAKIELESSELALIKAQNSETQAAQAWKQIRDKISLAEKGIFL